MLAEQFFSSRTNPNHTTEQLNFPIGIIKTYQETMHFHTGTINNKHIQPLTEFSLNEEYKIYHKTMDFPYCKSKYTIQ